MTSPEIKCQVPVFVHPTALYFYTNDANSYKQVITLFNPYEFVIKFKVLCNQPKKYVVVDPEGLIKPKCCVDLVIRHVDVNSMNENQTDKLRIQIFQSSNLKVLLGKKDLPLTLLPRKLQHDSSEMAFGTATSGNSLNTMLNINNTNFIPNSQLNQSNSRNNGEHINYLTILIGVVCLALLFLPTAGVSDSQYTLPKYLHLTFEMKLCAAYILGMVTMAILKY